MSRYSERHRTNCKVYDRSKERGKKERGARLDHRYQSGREQLSAPVNHEDSVIREYSSKFGKQARYRGPPLDSQFKVSHRYRTSKRGRRRSSETRNCPATACRSYFDSDFRVTSKRNTRAEDDYFKCAQDKDLDFGRTYFDNGSHSLSLDYGGSKTVYYTVKSDEDAPEARENQETSYSSNNREFFQEQEMTRRESNLSPVSSTSTALNFSAPFYDFSLERPPGGETPLLGAAFSGLNDVDLRFESRKPELESEICCQYQSLGCRLATKLDSITAHERDCIYNPQKARAACKTCKLLVKPEHDCIDELKEELFYARRRTEWIKCSNGNNSPESEDSYRRVWIHYFGDREEKVVKLMLSKSEDCRSLLRKSLDHLGLGLPPYADGNEEEAEYQLAFSSFHVLPASASLKSYSSDLPSEAHLLLIPKLITVKVSAKKLFYNNEHIVVSVPSSVPFQVDPSLTVKELKRAISQKIPVDWSKHQLIHCGRDLLDYMILYAVGILDGDQIEVNVA